jgi:hypothetical protein
MAALDEEIGSAMRRSIDSKSAKDFFIAPSLLFFKEFSSFILEFVTSEV